LAIYNIKNNIEDVKQNQHIII